MKKKRLIPVILFRNGWIVQSKSFNRYQNIGNPSFSVKRYSEWEADELIYLDISLDDNNDLRRDDLRHPNRSTLYEIFEDISKVSFMPITLGGRIRTLEDIRIRLSLCADKVSINSQSLINPKFVEDAAKEFGSQCIVSSIDTRRLDGKYIVMRNGGKVSTNYEAKDWAKQMANSGAGEILINSVDRDGLKTGYDIELIDQISANVNIPVIALGGVGNFDHFVEALEKTNVDAIAAANIFQYQDQSVALAKRYLYEKGFSVRKPFSLE